MLREVEIITFCGVYGQVPRAWISGHTSSCSKMRPEWMWDCPCIPRSSDYWIRVYVETIAPEGRTGPSAKAAAEPDGTGVRGARCRAHRNRRDDDVAGRSVCSAAGPRTAPGPLSRWAPGGFLRLRRAASRTVEEEDPRNSQRSRSVLQRKASLAAPLATGCHCVPHSPSLKIQIIFNFSFSFPIDKLSIAKAYLYFIFSWHRTKRSTILASIPVDFPYPDGERLLGNSLLHLSV